MDAATIRVAASAVALMLSAQGKAVELALPSDGWASWQVPAVGDARDQCCWHGMKPGNAARTACNLDNQRGSFGNRDDAKTDALRVYAHLARGKVERVRVLSASCPIESATPVRDLGIVATDDSARWLAAQVRRPGSIPEDSRENAIAALAMHPGDFSFGEVARLARDGEHEDERKSAMFWLASSRGIPGAEVVSRLMFGDPDSDVREHAAFAITVSRSPRIAADLIRLGTTDKVGAVRGQAWFWLAQTAAAESEQAIGAALRKDADHGVREQAVFALSQLPEDRGTRALIAVAEDRSLPAEQRKRAMFWLAQSDSPGAQAYLDKMLVGKATR